MRSRCPSLRTLARLSLLLASVAHFASAAGAPWLHLGALASAVPAATAAEREGDGAPAAPGEHTGADCALCHSLLAVGLLAGDSDLPMYRAGAGAETPEVSRPPHRGSQSLLRARAPPA